MSKITGLGYPNGWVVQTGLVNHDFRVFHLSDFPYLSYWLLRGGGLKESDAVWGQFRAKPTLLCNNGIV